MKYSELLGRTFWTL